MSVPEVLFVCVHNAGRSQMAAALLDHHAGGRVHVRSAGSEPADRINPAVVDALGEVGLDVTQAFPKPLTDEAVRAADVVITMGCGDACPVYPGKRYLDWQLDDPAGKSLDELRPIRDEIDRRVRELLTELVGEPPHERGDRSVRETSVRRVRAFNSATASQNKIHDDAVARQFGFAGGLVPGVDVYAYLTHLPAARWGGAWLEHGTMSGRFHRPVYDGDEVEIVAELIGPDGDGPDGAGPDGEMALTLRDSAGEACATATAGPRARPATAPDPSRWPEAPLPADPPPATPETLTAGATLGSLAFGFHADAAGAYLDEVGEDLALYRDEGIAHPGWLLRSANRLLAANVRLGPWIHVSSRSTHHGVVVDGDQLSTRGRVSAVFERKGHQFVTLDVLVVAGGTRPVLTVEHTAIYQPRRIT